MKFIRDKLLFLWNKVIQAYASYRVTVCAVVLLTLYEALHVFLYLFDRGTRVNLPIWRLFDYDTEVTEFLLLFILAAMFMESCLTYGRKSRGIMIIRILCLLLFAAIAAAVIWGTGLKDSEQFLHLSGDRISAWMQHFVVGYVLLLLLGTIYCCHRRSGVGFIEYLLHIFVNWCFATAVYFVLCVGVALVLLIVELLFLDDSGTLSGCGVILVTGLYYAPCCMTAMNNTDSNIDDPVSRRLFKYILSVLSVCALAVVYAYLLKILVVWELPSNEIFGIVSGLFCLGMPVWIICYFYRDDTRYMRFVQKLPYVLVPLIPVQAYCMCVRIYHNGMTPGRYTGMCMVIFELIVILIWRFWKDKLERVVVVLCAGVVIALFLPGINMYSMSNRWQLAFLETYYPKLSAKEALTAAEYGRLKGAYDYLKREPEMKAAVEQYNIYDPDFASQLADLDSDAEKAYLQHHYVHCCQMVGALDVDGYRRMDMLNQDERYDAAGGSLSVDFSAFRFYKMEDGEQETFTVDLSGFAEKCFAYEEEHHADKEEISDAMKPYRKIVIDADRTLYLNHFEVRYNEGIRDGEEYCEVTSVNVSGVLLTR